MDRTVSEQEQDLVALGGLHRQDVILELCQQGSKEGGPSKTNLRQSHPVGLHNGLDSHDFRVACVAIHGETMIRGIQIEMPRDAAKAEDREAAIRIVWLNNHTHIEES